MKRVRRDIRSRSRLPRVSRDKKDHISLSDAHNSRGIELADRGWLDEAAKEFQKAIELDPGSAHAHDNLATVWAEKKLWREALQEYLTALRLEPDSATAHYNLACFLAAHGGDMAIAEYEEAIHHDPEYPDSHLNLALTYADHDRLDDAKKEVVRLEPTNFDAWIDLGVCFAQKGFYAEAERAYVEARKLKADDLLLDYDTAALYAQWKRPEEALAALRRAVATDPAKVRGWLEADPMFRSLEGTPE